MSKDLLTRLDDADAAEAALQLADTVNTVLLAPSADQTIAGSYRVINSGGFVGELAEFTGASQHTAITTKHGFAFLTDGSAGTYTLADPTTGTDDGKRLVIMDVSGHAHTVNNGGASSGFNAGGASYDVATFNGSKGSCLDLVAYKGIWYIVNQIGMTGIA